MILVWSRKAITESLHTRRSCRETEEPVNNWLKPPFGNLHSLQLSHDLQQFLFFIDYGYAHASLLYFPLVMLSASHWLLAQARFCGRMHLPLSSNSIKSTGQCIIPISSTGCTCFNIHRIHSTCGYGDISAITLLILSLSGCSCHSILWYTAPVDMITFRWSRQSYQSICQQHPPYSLPQVTLICYKTIQSGKNKTIWRKKLTSTWENFKLTPLNKRKRKKRLKKRVSHMNDRASRNQALQWVFYWIDKHLGCLRCKILGPILEMDKGRPLTNGLEDKRANDDVQVFTRERSHRPYESRKERGKGLAIIEDYLDAAMQGVQDSK